jgi:hypothetical protein
MNLWTLICSEQRYDAHRRQRASPSEQLCEPVLCSVLVPPMRKAITRTISSASYKRLDLANFEVKARHYWFGASVSFEAGSYLLSRGTIVKKRCDME